MKVLIPVLLLLFTGCAGMQTTEDRAEIVDIAKAGTAIAGEMTDDPETKEVIEKIDTVLTLLGTVNRAVHDQPPTPPTITKRELDKSHNSLAGQIEHVATKVEDFVASTKNKDHLSKAAVIAVTEEMKVAAEKRDDKAAKVAAAKEKTEGRNSDSGTGKMVTGGIGLLVLLGELLAKIGGTKNA